MICAYLRGIGVLCLCLFFHGLTFSQINIEADRVDAYYEVGETAIFTVNTNGAGQLDYSFSYDNNTESLSSGSLNISGNGTIDIPLLVTEPGIVFLEVSKDGNIAKKAIAVSYSEIGPLEEEPIDFDAFWSSQKNLLEGVPLDIELNQIEADAYKTTYRINFSNIDGRKVYGYMSIPQGGGPFPAIITLPPFGDFPGIVQSEGIIAERGGAISLALNIHNAEPDQQDPNAYSPNDIADPAGYYYRYAILGTIRAIDYLFTRDDFDGQNIGVIGASQGGGLALMVAGIDQRVNLLAQSKAALCQHTGLKYNKASGFPDYIQESRNTVGTPTHEVQTIDAAKYYDAIYFASRYTGPSLNIVGYNDDVTPAATILAAYNSLKGPKILYHEINGGHNPHPDAYWDARYDFFRRVFPTMQSPPWPWPGTTLGYLIDAGPFAETNVNSALSMTGLIERNNEINPGISIRWTLEEGPGTVSFSTPNSYNTSASFSETGTYILRFSAEDKSMLSATGAYYSLVDYVTVNVSEGNNENNATPTVTLSTASDMVSDVFTVNVDFSQSVSGLILNDFDKTNVLLSNLQGSGSSYTFTATPVNEGAISILLPANKVSNSSNIGNEASNELNISYDQVNNNGTVSELTIIPNKSEATYEVSETILFNVTSNESGQVNYVIKRDQFSSPLKTGSFFLSAGSTYTISYNLDSPGSVLCELAQNGQFTSAGVLVSPYEIEGLKQEPSDFDTFWAGQKEALADIPIDPQVTLHSSSTYTKTYRVNLASIDNRRVYGYITIPEGNGPFPAMLTFPSFGNTSTLVQPEVALAERAGVISVSMSVLNVEPDEVDPNGYSPSEVSAPETNFYRYVLLGGVRMIDYIYSRSDFDGVNIGALGVSQGSGLALLLAGLDDRVTLLAGSNPSHCENAGLHFDKASGFPYFIHESRTSNGSYAHELATVDATAYYDGVNFAKRFDGPTLMLTGYRDDVNPPSTVFAAFNNLKGPKIMVHSLDLNHYQNPNEYWEGRYDLFRRFIPSTQQAPWPYSPSTQGYFVNAGADVSVDNGESTSLNAIVRKESISNPPLPVEWKMVRGPGIVTFSNPQSYSTNASFSEQGTYILRFIAEDYEKLNSDRKYFSLIDEVTVVVGSDNVGSSSLLINCPSNINVTADPQTYSLPVYWAEITGSSTCTSGVTNIQQTSGPSNGSTLQVGEYVISYQASDQCGNIESCSFNVVVNLPEVSQDYCSSSGAQPWVEYISNVSFGGINNDSGKDLYGDFTLQNTEVERNQTLPISITCSFSYFNYEEYIKVWIDYNQDGIFQEPSEVALEGIVEVPAYQSYSIPFTGFISIPSSASIGSTRMRISMQRDGFADACENFIYGEVEDYTVSINAGGNSSSINLQCPNSFTVFAEEGETLTVVSWSEPQVISTCPIGGAEYTLLSDVNNGGQFSLGQQTVRYSATDNCGNYDECSFNVTIEESVDNTGNPPAYCSASGNDATRLWISQVNFGQINSTSAKEGYNDRTIEQTSVFPGLSYPISITAKSRWNGYFSHVRVWIDFDQDGVFQNVEEIVMEDYFLTATNGVQSFILSGQVSIPSNASFGISRMRVIVSRDAAPDSCGEIDFGEVEDYSVNISNPNGILAQPGDNLFLSLMENNGKFDLQWVSNSDYKSAYYEIERSTDGVNFEPVKERPSETEAEVPIYYQEYDFNAIEGLNYFRVKQINHDGSTVVSNIQLGETLFDSTQPIVFPSPTKDYVNIGLGQIQGLSGRITITDGLGKVHLTKDFDAFEAPLYQFDISLFRSGVYFIRINPKNRRPVVLTFIVVNED